MSEMDREETLDADQGGMPPNKVLQRTRINAGCLPWRSRPRRRAWSLCGSAIGVDVSQMTNFDAKRLIGEVGISIHQRF